MNKCQGFNIIFFGSGGYLVISNNLQVPKHVNDMTSYSAVLK